MYLCLSLFRATSSWNVEVKGKIKEEIDLTDKENRYAKSDIESKLQVLIVGVIRLFVSAAIKRYFESRKRLHRESQPEHKERVSQQEKKRKSRSRRQRVSYCTFFCSILYPYLLHSYLIDVKNSSEVGRPPGGTSS